MGKIPPRVIRKRKRLGMTQADAGRLLGVSERTVNRLEADPLPPLLVDYLRLLGYSIGFYPDRKRKG